jgi:hypothetical protein
MFFVGLFASPIPYLLLLGIYMSGYAFFSLRASGDEPNDAGRHFSAEKTLQVTDAIGQPQADDATASWPDAPDAIAEGSRLLPSRYAEIKFILFPGQPCCLNFQGSNTSIRPPPVF